MRNPELERALGYIRLAEAELNASFYDRKYAAQLIRLARKIMEEQGI